MIEEIVDDVEIVLGTVIDLKGFSLGFIKNIQEALKVNSSFQDFQDDFDKGMYTDEMEAYLNDNTSEFKVCYDDINESFIFYIPMNSEDIEDKTIRELKEKLIGDMEVFTLFISYDDVDIFALED